jgi:hypothetical protein
MQFAVLASQLPNCIVTEPSEFFFAVMSLIE